MPYGEVYTSLATGTVDAAENDSSGYRNMKFYEQAPQLSLTGHFFLYKPVVANKAALAKMNADQRKEFDAIFAEMTRYQRKLFATNFDGDIEWLVKNGKVTVTKPDRAAFEAIVKPVQEKYAQKYGRDLVESIRNAR
jgi:TRAP-type transport system periplasmic protein